MMLLNIATIREPYSTAPYALQEPLGCEIKLHCADAPSPKKEKKG